MPPLQDKLAALPVRPGVYLFKDGEGRVVYVGKARSLRDRVRSYFQVGRPIDPRKGSMVAEIVDLDLVVTDSEMEALALENNVGSSRVDLQACKLEYSIVSPK